MNKRISRVTLFSITSLVLCLCSTFAAMATTKQASQVIDKVIATYGGENLQNIQSIEWQDQFSSFRYGQSYRPEEIDIENNYTDVFVDFANKRKSFRWVIGDKQSYRIRHWLFDGNTGYDITHARHSIAQNDSMSFDSADRRHSYLLDTYIIQALWINRATATWIGETEYLGYTHDRLLFTIAGNTEVELYIHQQSGYLSYMEKDQKNAKQTLRYHYKSHKKQQGIVYAQQAHLTRGGQPNRVVSSRKVVFNQQATEVFKLPSDYNEFPATMDMSKMSVQEIAKGVYLAGQDWGYSVFVDVGKGFIATGGYSGLSERLKAVKSFANVDKPLLKLVVSHHHIDHLGGVSEALKLGAKLIVVEQHINSVSDEVGQELTREHIDIVERISSFADGQVVVFDLPNSHSSHNLMTYIPAAELLFTVDFYYSRQLSGSPSGGVHLENLTNKLNTLNFSVEKFAAAHSARVLTGDDFATSITTIIEPVCPNDWIICHAVQTQLEEN